MITSLMCFYVLIAEKNLLLEFNIVRKMKFFRNRFLIKIEKNVLAAALWFQFCLQKILRVSAFFKDSYIGHISSNASRSLAGI